MEKKKDYDIVYDESRHPTKRIIWTILKKLPIVV